jgi:hypothetical protein
LQDYPVWSAESPLWNEVVRGGDINAADEYPFLCPRCFCRLAEDKGIADKFRLTAPRPLVELKKVTTSGRVWNQDIFLWEDPTEEVKEER